MDGEDISNQIVPVARDRTARVLASQNMVNVNANREIIQKAIEQDVTSSIEGLFGIQPHSLQIVGINPSESFMRSIDEATKAKNEAIRAQNQLRTREFEAQQAAAVAKGSADAAIQAARGDAEATRLRAEAEKTRLVLEGEGQKANLTAQIQALGGADKYLDYMRAKAALQWNGQQPQIVAGNGAGTNFVIPLPTMTNNR